MGTIPQFIVCYTTMKIGILQTDSVLPQFKSQFGDYPDMFIALLRDAAPTLQFATFNVLQGNYPDTIGSCDAYLITGSKASVYEPMPWIEQLQNYVRQLHQAKKKLIAVCFGHQLVAQALGGRTERSHKGWGVGVHNIPVHRQPPWMIPALSSYNIVSSHQDQVTSLPPGATLIAGGEFCPHSLFQVGQHIIAIQGHPEFSKEYAKAMLHYRREKIAAAQFEQAMQSWGITPDSQSVAKWFVQFLNKPTD